MCGCPGSIIAARPAGCPVVRTFIRNSTSIVSSPTFRSKRSFCRARSSASAPAFRPKTSGSRSISSFFHWLTCTGCTWCSCAIAWTVFSPCAASSATRALTSARCCLRLPSSRSFHRLRETAYHNDAPGFKSGVHRFGSGPGSMAERSSPSLLRPVDWRGSLPPLRGVIGFARSCQMASLQESDPEPPCATDRNSPQRVCPMISWYLLNPTSRSPGRLCWDTGIQRQVATSLKPKKSGQVSSILVSAGKF